MAYGLQKGSELKDAFEKLDKDIAVHYRVVAGKLDLRALKQRKVEIEKALTAEEPSQQELLKYAKQAHPFYVWHDQGRLESELKEIDDLLEAVG